MALAYLALAALVVCVVPLLVVGAQAVAGVSVVALDQQLDLERTGQRQLIGTPDNIEGVTAFLEKRAAKFSGRG